MMGKDDALIRIDGQTILPRAVGLAPCQVPGHGHFDIVPTACVEIGAVEIFWSLRRLLHPVELPLTVQTFVVLGRRGLHASRFALVGKREEESVRHLLVVRHRVWALPLPTCWSCILPIVIASQLRYSRCLSHCAQRQSQSEEHPKVSFFH